MSIGIFPKFSTEVDEREAFLFGLAFIFVLLAALALAVVPAVREDSWSALGARWTHLVVLPVWLGSFGLIRKIAQSHHPSRDPLLLPLISLLTGWGILVIWRLAPGFGARQTGWLFLSSLILAGLLRSSPDLHWLRRYRYIWLAAGIGLLVLTLFFGTNPSGGESKLWLGCCGVFLQPSEPLRLLLVAFLASFLADRLVVAVSDQKQTWISRWGPLVGLWGVAIALLFLQRDLGTGTLFLLLLALLLYVASGQWRILLLSGGMVVVSLFIGYSLFEVVQIRVDAWLNPWSDPIGGSYQIIQSLIAVSSGGVFGRGIGMGAPGYVPAVHTDFIFTAIAEEWGLLGGIGMIALIAILVSRGLRVAIRKQDPFAVFLAAGISLSLGLQAILIIGGTIRYLPLSGVTLPFVSYGGSSLVTSFVGIGLLIILSGRDRSPSPYSERLYRLQTGMGLAWAGLVVVLGWWSVLRGPDLVLRTDNPRRGLDSQFSIRGEIIDRGGILLAWSQGERGGYTRDYPYPSAAAVVGFDSSVFGQLGIERSMDPVLRGETQPQAFEVWWSRLVTGFPPPGLDVRLTLDVELQDASASLLKNRIGAVVIMDAINGDILTLASSPSFDPNQIALDWESLMSRSEAPFLNRSIMGSYQPGTSFGLFLVAVGMEEYDVQPDEFVTEMAATFEVNGSNLACTMESLALSSQTLIGAASYGCPQPIAELGSKLGMDLIRTTIEVFEFDKPIELRIETLTPGRLEDPSGLEDLRMTAVGQGDITLSPLHFARAFSALVNGGELPAARLVEATRSGSNAWEVLPSMGERLSAISNDTGHDLLGVFPDLGDGVIGVVAQAVAGPDMGIVSWFFGADPIDSSPKVVVVALEGGTPLEVLRIGLELIDLTKLRSLP